MSKQRASTKKDSTPVIKPTDLRGILKYVPRFQNQTFIIAIDGAIVADENLPNLLVDIAVLRSLGIKVALVHGIGQQITELSQQRKIPVTNTDGTNITDAPTLDLAIRASARVSQLILEGLTQGAMKCAITNAIRAIPTGIIKGVSQQHTGKVDRVDKDLLNHLLAAGIIPIIQPVGYSPEGAPLRINSDLLAAEVAEALNASKIIYLTPHNGLEIDGILKRDIDVNTLKKLLQTASAKIPAPILSKARHALRALETGTPRVHIVDGRIFDGLINEIFSSEGVGTLIYANDYQQIRRATKADVRVIHNLTRNAVRREELLHRTQQAIEKNIDHYYVFEIDDNIVACAALYHYPEKPQVAEIGSLYVQSHHQNRDIGRKMVDYAAMKAKEQGAKTLVALSTQSYSFFTSEMNFEETDKKILPKPRLQQSEESGRNPKVLRKKL